MAKQKKLEIALRNTIHIIDPWLAYQRWNGELPSIAVGVVHGNKTVFAKAYGHADLKRHRKATIRTVYRITSNSKVFTALGIMGLQQAGKLKISDRVSKHLPWFESKKQPELARITIKDLLTNSSGLMREGYTKQWTNDRFATAAQIRKFMQRGALTASKRGAFKYSNLGFAVLGLLIETVSGQTYAEFMRAQITEPLGLKYTDARLTARIRANLARGYGRLLPGKTRPVFSDPETNAMEAATGFSSNVLDLTKFVAAQFYGTGKIFSDKIKKQMYRPAVRNDHERSEYAGLGYEIWKVGKRMVVGHGGGFQGFLTMTAFDPKLKVGVVVLTNALGTSPRWFSDEIFKLLDYFLKNSKDFPTVPASKFKIFEGFYRGRWGDDLVRAASKKLVVISPDGPPAGRMAVLTPARPAARFAIKVYGGDKNGEWATFIDGGKKLIWGDGSAPERKIKITDK